MFLIPNHLLPVPSKVLRTEPLITPVPSKFLKTEPETSPLPSVICVEPLTTPLGSDEIICAELLIVPPGTEPPPLDDIVIFPLPEVIVTFEPPINEPLNTLFGKSEITCEDCDTIPSGIFVKSVYDVTLSVDDIVILLLDDGYSYIITAINTGLF